MTDATTTGRVEPRLQSVLVTLGATGAAPVCEGDSCFVPGAEGDWTEVPD